MNIQQKIVIIIMDILLITELCISMYFASQKPELLTPIFVKYFFSMAVPTLILARIFVKRLKSK